MTRKDAFVLAAIIPHCGFEAGLSPVDGLNGTGGLHLGRQLWSQAAAKTDMQIAMYRLVPVAKGDSCPVSGTIPGTAPQNFARARGRAGRILAWRVTIRILGEPVRAPFPDVAGHIGAAEGAIAARAKVADRRGSSVTTLHRIASRCVPGIAPGIDSPIDSAGRLFPLGLGQ